MLIKVELEALPNTYNNNSALRREFHMDVPDYIANSKEGIIDALTKHVKSISHNGRCPY